jgi:hypothetical protein
VSAPIIDMPSGGDRALVPFLAVAGDPVLAAEILSDLAEYSGFCASQGDASSDAYAAVQGDLLRGLDALRRLALLELDADATEGIEEEGEAA